MRGTIAAIATPSGAGGVGIVRLSGPDAIPIAARLAGRPPEALEDRRLVLAVLHDAAGERLDEALVVAMRGPRSYTGEDVAELQAHGGPLNLARILAAALSAGARSAEPGEFTRRAFENGRLDLTRAEAVAELIGAASERALRAAQARLAGSIGERVRVLRDQLTAARAEIEAEIDFPEEGLAFAPVAELAGRLRSAADEAARLASTYRTGAALRDGVTIAIVGAANVGKSSLLNRLAEEERALVAPDAGTTRDWLEMRVVWEGVPVTLVDTAGEREAMTEVEGRGIALGRARAGRADLRLRVRDASAPDGAAADGGALEVWNKIDLAAAPEGVMGVSALTGAGIDALRAALLKRILGEAADADEGPLVASERQRALLEEAAAAARAAVDALRDGRPTELAASDARIAELRLAAILGEDVGDAMLDSLFARFCIGK